MKYVGIYRQLVLGLALLPALAWAAKDGDFKITNDKVVAVTRYLEAKPLSEEAPVLRALMLQWEEKSEDVLDLVCGEVLSPILKDNTPHGPELLAQFIFGSAALQIADPSQKGVIATNQLAGMQSMLKAYRNFLVAEPTAHITYLDEWVAHEDAGMLAEKFAPVAAKCKMPD